MGIDQILQIFSTREVATFIWACILILCTLLSKNIRHSLGKLLKTFFDKHIIKNVVLYGLYICIIILLLKKINYWDCDLLKDTCFWYLFSSFGLLFGVIGKAKEYVYFKRVVINNVKAVIVLEYLVNFYTFPFLIEFILIPILTIIALSQVFLEHDIKEDINKKKLLSYLNHFLSFIGIIVIIYTAYKTIIDSETFFSSTNLRIFLLPIFLSLLSLPFLYCITLYVNYESLFVVIKHSHEKKGYKTVRRLKLATLIYANIDIVRIFRVWKRQSQYKNTSNEYDFIKNISRRHRYVIGHTAKLKIFNNVKQIIDLLSMIGIGQLTEWQRSNSEDDLYISMTNYYQFGNKDITYINNTLAYYLTGKETYLEKLELVLDVGHLQDKGDALMRFIDIANQTFNVILIPFPDDFALSIHTNGEYDKEYDTYKIELRYEKYERIEIYKLIITTK